MLGIQQSQSQIPAQRRSEVTGCYTAYLSVSRSNLITASGNAAFQHLKTCQFTPDSQPKLLLEGSLSNKIRFLQLNCPAQTGFQRRYIFIQLITVQGQTGFKTKGISAAKPCRLQSKLPACFH